MHIIQKENEEEIYKVSDTHTHKKKIPKGVMKLPLGLGRLATEV